MQDDENPGGQLKDILLDNSRIYGMRLPKNTMPHHSESGSLLSRVCDRPEPTVNLDATTRLAWKGCRKEISGWQGARCIPASWNGSNSFTTKRYIYG